MQRTAIKCRQGGSVLEGRVRRQTEGGRGEQKQEVEEEEDSELEDEEDS